LTPEIPADIRDIAVWLATASGISTSIIGAHSLRRAIQLRLEATELADIPAYQNLLLNSPEEQQCLVELVVVPETWFFRDRYPFSHLREHVQRLLEGGGGQPAPAPAQCPLCQWGRALFDGDDPARHGADPGRLPN